jgi:aryl-alcohol dehydrogenase-like predicted oxidoreductase
MLAWAALASGFVRGRLGADSSNVDEAARVYLSEENRERLRRADELSARHNVTILQIALGFVLGQPFPVSALIGPSTVGHLDEALGAVDLELSADELRYLDLGES